MVGGRGEPRARREIPYSYVCIYFSLSLFLFLGHYLTFIEFYPHFFVCLFCFLKYTVLSTPCGLLELEGASRSHQVLPMGHGPDIETVFRDYWSLLAHSK